MLRLLTLLALVLLAPSSTSSTGASVLTGEFNWVHDPSRIVESGGKYYVFHTGDNLPSRTSTDLIRWEKGPNILQAVPEWARKAVPAARGNNVWAPDVIKVGDKYFLFYSYSTFGSRVSVTGLLTSPTLDPAAPNYAWQDEGLVLATTQASDYNAIDAGPVLDEKGDLWLSIGSWQRGGIKVVKLDRSTGKPVGQLVSVAAGVREGPEAPYLHFRGGFFYLFENEGTCCAGMNSGYTIMVGRSKSPSGPFLDKQGRDLAKGGGTVFMSTDGSTIGPGHVGILHDRGLDRLTFHFYDGRANGIPTLGMRTLLWGADGWPRVAPELEAGRYSIVSKASGLALGVQNSNTADGTPIDQSEYRGGATQGWNVTPTGDGYYGISSLGTRKYFDLFECKKEDGTKVSLYPWLNNDCQKWRIEAVSENTFRLISKGGGTALTLPGGSKAPLVAVQGFAWKGEPEQEWIFRKLP